MPEKKVRVKMADGDKKYGKISRKRKYLLVSDVSHRNWGQQEQGAAMKRLELQYLAGQIIQIMRGQQAKG